MVVAGARREGGGKHRATGCEKETEKLRWCSRGRQAYERDRREKDRDKERAAKDKERPRDRCRESEGARECERGMARYREYGCGNTREG